MVGNLHLQFKCHPATYKAMEKSIGNLFLTLKCSIYFRILFFPNCVISGLTSAFLECALTSREMEEGGKENKPSQD